MPGFNEQEERTRCKADELAPYVTGAFRRKQRMTDLTGDETPPSPGHGR